MASHSGRNFDGLRNIQVSDLAAVSHSADIEAVPTGKRGAITAAATAVPVSEEIVVSDFTALLLPYYEDYYRWNWSGNGPAIGVTFVTYSFREDGALPDPSTVSYSPNAVFSFSSSQRQAARDVLDIFSAATGLIFVEVEDGGMLDFMGATGTGYGGFANYPSPTRSSGGGVWVEGTVETDFSTGSYEFYVLLHEIGHGIGLKHPFEGDITLDPSLNNRDNTVMSYTSGLTSPETVLGYLDLDALYFLYGTAVDLVASEITYIWDEVTDLFTVIGGALDDAISGVLSDNHIEGGDGNDHILGGGSDDVLMGGAGDDVIVTGYGQSLADGGEGNDILRSLGYDSELIGGAGDDRFENYQQQRFIDGGEGHDTIVFRANYGGYTDLSSGSILSIEEVIGSDWSDTITGGASSETIRAGGGNDTVNGSAGADRLEGGTGSDTLSYWGSSESVNVNLATGVALGGEAEGDIISGFEIIIGSGGDDTLVGDDRENIFVYIGGADTIDGGAGLDSISFQYYSLNHRFDIATETFEWLDAGTGQYFAYSQLSLSSIEGVISGSGEDLISGSADANMIDAGSGNDVLYGYGGNDILAGGAGLDFIAGGSGNDDIHGDDGNDRLFGEAGNDYISGGAGDDYAVGNEGDDVIAGGGGNDRLQGREGNDRIFGEEGADYIRGDEGDDYLVGNAGNDLLVGGIGDDILQGREGDDRLFGEDGLDFLFGFEGDDYMVGNAGNDFLAGYEGNDKMYGSEGNDALYGMLGADYMKGGDDDDRMYGNEGGDALFGDAGNDRLYGYEDNDRLYGGGGNDYMKGGDGDDLLDGGDKFDSLFGEAGVDTFVFTGDWRHDKVMDWQEGETLDLSSQGTTFSSLTIVQSGADTVININGDSYNSITLIGIQASTIDSGDFNFGAPAAPAVPQTNGLVSIERVEDADPSGAALVPAADEETFEFANLKTALPASETGLLWPQDVFASQGHDERSIDGADPLLYQVEIYIDAYGHAAIDPFDHHPIA